MIIGALLPHTLIFGGVKRFLELGNHFVNDGHEFIIFCPEKCRPTWFDYHGKTELLENLQNYQLDALFFTEIQFLNNVLGSNSKLKIFYHVYRRNYLKFLKKHPEITVFVNSTNIYRYDRMLHSKKKLVKAIGAVEMQDYQEPKPGSLITILTYGRLSRKKKGVQLVVKACEQLYKKGYNIQLLLFDFIVDNESQKMVDNFTCEVPFKFILNKPFHENPEFFRKADIFVSAEKKAGWNNTTAEAMALGIPVVATKSGTMDFLIDNKTGIKVRRNVFSIQKGIEKMINQPELRKILAKQGHQKIQEFSWDRLYATISGYIKKNAK